MAGLPLEPGSCRGLYCSHVLEHLALDDCDRALANSARYLQRGGTFRIVVPDLAACVRAYVNDASEAASIHFMQATGLGVEHRARSPRR